MTLHPIYQSFGSLTSSCRRPFISTLALLSPGHILDLSLWETELLWVSHLLPKFIVSPVLHIFLVCAIPGLLGLLPEFTVSNNLCILLFPLLIYLSNFILYSFNLEMDWSIPWIIFLLFSSYSSENKTKQNGHWTSPSSCVIHTPFLSGHSHAI